MVKLLNIRLGVADDPSSLQPSLNDCLEAMMQQSEPMMLELLQSLALGTAAAGPRRIAGFQHPAVKSAVDSMNARSNSVAATFQSELSRLVYEGGGKEQVQAEVLRFEDLQLFEDSQLDQSIEVARAHQEVSHAVDDSLPALDALVSTLLGWRTIQPGLNPVRPDVYVRALQATLAEHVPDPVVREKLITPAAGLLGVQLRKLYRELTDWLRSSGIEPAVPMGGRVQKGGGATGKPVADSMAKTLLTLERLRKLLAGDFDHPQGRPDFLHTVPASMGMLQDMQQVDKLVKRLEDRPRAAPAPKEPVDMLADAPASEAGQSPQRIGKQLGDEVVRLMFDNLQQDTRLLSAFKRELRAMQPAVLRLTEADSRFFSDRNHPARQLLDRLAQRSLGFSSEQDEGWPRFMQSVQSAGQWLESQVVDADSFGELLDHLQEQWDASDAVARQRREEAARALLHAEQRNLLAQKLGAEFDHMLRGLDIADFVGDFLRGSWAQVVAEAQLSCEDGSSDPHGYRALVDDLIWSVQKTSAQRGRARRLVQMIPGLLARLSEGLKRIGYPPELTQRFFDHLITLHRAAVQGDTDVAAQAAAAAAWAENSEFGTRGRDEVKMWLDQSEAVESGYVADEDMDLDFVSSPIAARQEAQAQEDAAARQEAARKQAQRLEAERQDAAEREEQRRDEAQREATRREAIAREAAIREAAAKRAAAQDVAKREAARKASADAAAAAKAAQEAKAQAEAASLQAAAAREAAQAAEAEAARTSAMAAVPAGATPQAEELRIGAWVEIQIKGEWVRAQLTWSSPHATLFMFTAASGTAHSMSRRTLDKLRASAHMRVVADRPVVDEALDQVALAALKNSLDKPG